MKKRLGSGIRAVLLAGAAAFILGGAAFGAEGGDVLPQVLLDSQWDWYSTSDPEYKDLFHNQYELARLNQESAAVFHKNQSRMALEDARGTPPLFWPWEADRLPHSDSKETFRTQKARKHRGKTMIFFKIT